MLPEESKYISEVLRKLIDIPMVRNIKIDSKYCMWDHNNGKLYVDQNTISVDEVIVTPPNVTHPNWPKTVEAIKYIMDWGMDRMHGFSITFNESYTKFKKSTM